MTKIIKKEETAGCANDSKIYSFLETKAKYHEALAKKIEKVNKIQDSDDCADSIYIALRRICLLAVGKRYGFELTEEDKALATALMEGMYEYLLHGKLNNKA